MSEHNQGGPAFPRPACFADGEVLDGGDQGMTLLEYYAGQALMGHGPIQPGEHYPTIADSCARAARALVVALKGGAP